MQLIPRGLSAMIGRLRGDEDDRPATVSCELPGLDDGTVSEGPALMLITGRLTQASYDEISAAAGEMIESGVGAAGVLIDSGGGSIAGLDGAVLSLTQLRDALGDNLWTFAQGTAGSAAYGLLACGGRGKVCAATGAQIGSLGAKIRLEDDSRLWAESFLTTVHEITDNQPLKVAGAPGFPISKEALDFEQDQVRRHRLAYQALVATARRVPLATIARAAGKGGLYESRQARDFGLIDRILSKPEFLAAIGGANTTEAAMPNESTPVTPAQPTPAGTQAGTQPAPEATPAQPVAAEAQPPTPPPAGVQAAMTNTDAQLAALTAQVTALTGLVQTTIQAGVTERRQSVVGSYKARLDACVTSCRIVRAAADAAQAAVTAMVDGGQAEAAEKLVASYEAMAPAQFGAGLEQEVTFQPIDADAKPVTRTINLGQFGAVAAPDGTFRPAEGAADAARIVDAATAGDGEVDSVAVLRGLEAAWKQDGVL